MKYLLLITLFFSSLFGQNNLELKTIKFLGELKPNIKKRVSIKTIESLGIKYYDVIDPYTKKQTNYAGVNLKIFASFFGNKNTKSLIFKAIDGYEVTITKEHWEKNSVVLVTRVENEIVTYDKKGPLRIIYPNYKKADENFAKNLPNWIWMINSIEFR